MENDAGIEKNFPRENVSRKPKPYRSNSLTLDEQERLLSVTESFEDLTLLRLALSTGMRREDIVGIEIGNIDLDNLTLTSIWKN